MKRAPFVVLGTIAGTAGVLAFPVHSARVTGALPAASTAAPEAAATPAPSASAAPPATPASTPVAAPATTATGADTAFRFGDVAVSVTVTGGRITNVAIAALHETDNKSAAIDSYAVPQLEQQVLAANSASIQGVSGATYTSRAFAQSLASALAKLGFSG